MKNISGHFVTLLLIFTISISCTSIDLKIDDIDTNTKDPTPKDTATAKIVSVTYSSNAEKFKFSVGISSPDTGCDQYANWWEILSEDGKLLYRRILGHSHVNEQPFIRTGANVMILPNEIIIIRAHMHPTGYATQVFKGSINDDFVSFETEDKFANDVESQTPLPTGCAF